MESIRLIKEVLLAFALDNKLMRLDRPNIGCSQLVKTEDFLNMKPLFNPVVTENFL